jgi:DNA-binding response OmpR family regulator
MRKEFTNILEQSTLLIIEDDDAIREKLKLVMESYVFKIYEAKDAKDALNTFYSHNPNIVITDFELPQKSGLEIVKEIRQHNKDIPIVVISAYSHQEILLEFIPLNLTQYIVKPIDFEKLNEVLFNCAKELIEHGIIETRLHGNTSYSFSKKCIIRDEKTIYLTPIEIKFLELMLKNKNKLLTKEFIDHYIYEGDIAGLSSLNNLVSKLRKKIGYNIIRNISKTGYIVDIT